VIRLETETAWNEEKQDHRSLENHVVTGNKTFVNII